MKAIILSIVLTCFYSFVSAQINHADSMRKQAKEDVRNFILSKRDMADFRKNKYFEPKAENVSNTELLNDPEYLQAYRDAAFKKTKRRRTAGHYLLIGGAVYIVIAIVGTIYLVKQIGNSLSEGFSHSLI